MAPCVAQPGPLCAGAAASPDVSTKTKVLPVSESSSKFLEVAAQLGLPSGPEVPEAAGIEAASETAQPTADSLPEAPFRLRAT